MKLAAVVEQWPLRRPFTIARGTRSEATVVLVTVELDGLRGRGECGPNTRYDETPDQAVRMIEDLSSKLLTAAEPHAAGGSSADPASMARALREQLRRLLPAGAARNGVDAALWDLEAKARSRRVWDLAGMPAPGPVVTAFTLALDEPDAMAEAAAAAQDLPLLKAKLGRGGSEDLHRIRAVREAAPHARLIVDANEGWTLDDLRRLAPPLADLGVEMVEQPVPAGDDEELRGLNLPLPICADESCIDAGTVAGLRGKYDAVNIKLDKAGGLTEAMEMAEEARRYGLDLMVGCMLGTSLAMAPALLLAGEARWTDLDGPLLLARDREHPLRYENGRIEPPAFGLWG